MADLKFKVGDKVLVTGPIYQSANGTLTSGEAKNRLARIRKVAVNAAHPYMIEGIFGWFTEASVKEYVEIPVEINDKVKVLKPITYNGQKVILRYKDYVVEELIGDKAKITHNHVQTIVVNAYNLEKIK